MKKIICAPSRFSTALITATVLLPFHTKAIKLPSFAWSGLVEIEAFHHDNYANESESDLVLATAFLAAEAEFQYGISAAISLLYEEDDTDLEIDEAFIAKEFDGLTVTAGRYICLLARFPLQ